MREQQLARREAARVVVAVPGSRAEKGDLEATGRRSFALQPAGHVPPLGAKARVRAVVARKAEHVFARYHVVALRGRRARSSRQRQPWQGFEERTPLHVSSRIATSGPAAVAERIASAAAAEPQAASSRPLAINSVRGTWVCIVQ